MGPAKSDASSTPWVALRPGAAPPEPDGGPALPFARAEEGRIEAEWESHLGAARMDQLRDALTALSEITDPYLPPGP